MSTFEDHARTILDSDRKKRIIEVLDMIAEDVESDAKNFDGQPFNGRTVAEYFGNQGAAIQALALICKALVENYPTP